MVTKDLAGYILDPKTYPNCPGHPRLTLTLRKTPTEEHYDPETVHVHVVITENHTAPITVRHPWSKGSEKYRVCPGRIYVEDAKQKRLEFYALGGTLTIQSDDQFTVCTLTSPAPIMELSMTPCISELLTEEIEGLIAERKAIWEIAPVEFSKRLSTVDPLRLYLACLLALRDKFSTMPYSAMSDCALQLKHFLGDEIEIVQEQLNHPASHFTLPEVL